MRPRFFCAIFVIFGLLPVSGIATSLCNDAAARDRAEEAASHYLNRVKNSPPDLRNFLQLMPKGGDLHNHLGGAIYAESFIRWAAEDGLCIDIVRLALVQAACSGNEDLKPATAALGDGELYNALIDSISMRNFTPGTVRSGHDQFFQSFFKIAVAPHRLGDMLAEVARRAAGQNISYLELMITLQFEPTVAHGAAVGVKDLARAEAQIRTGGFASMLDSAIEELDEAYRRKDEILGCDNDSSAAGCDVTLRVLSQAIRTVPPGSTFTHFIFGFELAKRDPRVVGINLVAPEDDRRALDHYDLHMRMLDYLWKKDPSVNIALHAGELALGLVPPKHLGWHIERAVAVGHASRIGHGVDVIYDPDLAGALDLLMQRDILVEVNLTSNDVILGISGSAHPWPLYRRAGVATALSTDDEGVSRIDLTHEFQRAVETYDLGYADLKSLVRNSLAYSFLPGEGLWQGGTGKSVCNRRGEESDACRAFLEKSEKAALQWDLEQRFRSFEQRFAR